jgi:hypothetical protein
VLIVRVGYPVTYAIAAVFYGLAGLLYFRHFVELNDRPRPVVGVVPPVVRLD